MEKDIYVGLVGFGNAGKYYHAPFISSVNGLQIVKIRETKEENIEYINSYFPGVHVVNDTAAIFNDPMIQIVVIAAPNQYHFCLAKEALLAGKHVVVDKPFTLTTTEADALIKLAEERDLVLTVYHNRRFASDYRTVEKIVRSGALGEVVEYEAHFDRFRKQIRQESWKEKDVPGAGIFYDMGPHLIDQVLKLFGIPKEVYADLRIQRKGGSAIDNFEVVLDYGTLKASLKGSMLVKQPRPQFALYGDEGCFIKYGMDIQENDARNGKLPKSTELWGMEPESMWGQLTYTKNGVDKTETIKSEKGSYTDFYLNLYNCLNNGEDLYVKPIEARNVIRVIELAIQSNEQNQKVKWSYS